MEVLIVGVGSWKATKRPSVEVRKSTGMREVGATIGLIVKPDFGAERSGEKGARWTRCHSVLLAGSEDNSATNSTAWQ